MQNKFDAPHQPDESADAPCTIELFPGRDFEQALLDLEGFDRVWLVSWFHRNKTWKPKVRPPRGSETKRGVFATRSPHRPNAIGLTAVPLLGVSGRTITVGSCDLVDGTPILDIKPYIPTVDSFPDSNIGWLQSVEEFFAQPVRFQVEIEEIAKTQLEWLGERGIQFIDRAVKILQRDPSVHRSRRIKKRGPNLFRMGCAQWRIFFSLQGNVVRIRYIQSGYMLDRLQSAGSEVIVNRDEQILFTSIWPQRSAEHFTVLKE